MFNKFEKHVLIEALKTYFENQEMELLPQDENGKYYGENHENDTFDEKYSAKVANTITKLITKINAEG